MRKLQSVAAVTLFATALGAGAQDSASPQPGDTPSSAVRLTDSELDQIVAGKVITVFIAPPSTVDQFIQHSHGPTIIILGSGKGNDIFGNIVMSNGDIKTIPGRN